MGRNHRQGTFGAVEIAIFFSTHSPGDEDASSQREDAKESPQRDAQPACVDTVAKCLVHARPLQVSASLSQAANFTCSVQFSSGNIITSQCLKQIRV